MMQTSYRLLSIFFVDFELVPEAVFLLNSLRYFGVSVGTEKRPWLQIIIIRAGDTRLIVRSETAHLLDQLELVVDRWKESVALEKFLHFCQIKSVKIWRFHSSLNWT